MVLMSVDELAARLADHDPRLRIADVRWYLNRPGAGRAAYDAGHIQGAIFLDLDTDLSAPEGPGRHPLPDPVDFARRLGALGIGSNHDVVAYDDVGGTVAARLWWMLDTLGHRSVRVLDGGIGAWQAAGHLVTAEASVHPPATLNLMDRWSRTITREALIPRLGAVTLLDARAPERYRGETEPVDPLPGHIPTAISAPTAGNLGPDGRFLPPDALRRRFEALGAPAGELVTSCGSGTNACHHALAMRIAGLPDPILYVGSYSDWSRSGMPVATGPHPGRPPLTG
jgi:thiosulfate/3-mercaptopyruvate sulfurtransferase